MAPGPYSSEYSATVTCADFAVALGSMNFAPVRNPAANTAVLPVPFGNSRPALAVGFSFANERVFVTTIAVWLMSMRLPLYMCVVASGRARWPGVVGGGGRAVAA